jgi:hypothetical protein
MGYKKIKLLSIVNNKNTPTDLFINKDIYKSELKLFYNYLEKGNYDNKKTFLLNINANNNGVSSK